MSLWGTQKGQRPRDLKLHKFDKIWFTKQKAEELGKRGIPYPNDWFLVMRGYPDGIEVIGSMGGRAVIGWDEAVITSHTIEGSEPIRVFEEVEGIKTYADRWVGSGLTLGEDVTVTKGILQGELGKKLTTEVHQTILKIVGGNPGAARAACALIKKEGLKKVKTRADVERILGISADAPFEKLLKHRGDLWDQFQAS